MTWKYHKQYRLPEFDYSSNNIYYITVCTKNQKHSFGEIIGEKMLYSEIGLKLIDLLKDLSENTDYLKLHDFVVMPNHIHFLAEIFIEGNDFKIPEKGLHPLVPKSISSVTNHLKGNLKRWCNENSLTDFEWQARFRDRIVRNYEEFQQTKKYIENNISTWNCDPENEAVHRH
ncbi:transposase [Kaistella palustris]|uniref:transposase n=1 Tax=Kaistella palustris TaxID=493376 RepID=UPI00041F4D02|nr:transposase [Kaistella palustris]